MEDNDRIDDTADRANFFGNPVAPPRILGLLTPVRGFIRKQVIIHREELVLGRDESLDVVITDNSVSRRHAVITRKGEEYFLRDLGSRNGTYVDGVPVIFCALHRGDRIEIGESLFTFDWLLELQE